MLDFRIRADSCDDTILLYDSGCTVVGRDVLRGKYLSNIVERNESFFLFVEIVEGSEQLSQRYLFVFLKF